MWNGNGEMDLEYVMNGVSDWTVVERMRKK